MHPGVDELVEHAPSSLVQQAAKGESCSRASMGVGPSI